VEEECEGYGDEGECDGEQQVQRRNAPVGRDGGGDGNDECENAVSFCLCQSGEAFLRGRAELLLLTDLFEDAVAIALIEIGDLSNPCIEGSVFIEMVVESEGATAVIEVELRVFAIAGTDGAIALDFVAVGVVIGEGAADLDAASVDDDAGAHGKRDEVNAEEQETGGHHARQSGVGYLK